MVKFLLKVLECYTLLFAVLEKNQKTVLINFSIPFGRIIFTLEIWELCVHMNQDSNNISRFIGFPVRLGDRVMEYGTIYISIGIAEILRSEGSFEVDFPRSNSNSHMRFHFTIEWQRQFWFQNFYFTVEGPFNDGLAKQNCSPLFRSNSNHFFLDFNILIF